MANHTEKHRVAVVGSGNWGTTVAKTVAENTAEHPHLFYGPVQMWVFEEEVMVPKESKGFEKYKDKKTNLTEIINDIHENVKYLPGIILPDNVIANPNVQDTVKDATIIIFNIPHQFMEKTLADVQGHCLPFARSISCVKGVDVADDTITLYSELVMEKLAIYCGSLSGANIAPEVANENFCETTIGYDALGRTGRILSSRMGIATGLENWLLPRAATSAPAPWTCRAHDSCPETCSNTPNEITDIKVLSLTDSTGDAKAVFTLRIASKYLARAWLANSGCRVELAIATRPTAAILAMSVDCSPSA